VLTKTNKSMKIWVIDRGQGRHLERENSLWGVLARIPAADYVRRFSNEKEVAMSGGGKG